MPKRRRSRTRYPSTFRLAVATIAVLGLLTLTGCGDAAVWLDGARGAEPTPTPGGVVPEPTGEGDEPLAKELGGYIDYGEITGDTGQRSGITATITPEMLAAADRDELGSEADSDIRPPGFDELPERNRARGHLLGRQLGGSGDVEANLVAMYQTRANSPVMRDYENAIADAVEAGETITYQVQPLYDGPDDGDWPRAVRLRASGDQGFRLDVEVENSEEAPVVEHTVPES